MSKKNLTPKQKLFVYEYLIDLNATQAAIRAGYSAKTAVDIGCENLEKPEIAEAIQERMDKRAEKVGVSAETVLKKLLDLATVDLAKAYDINGRLLPIHDIPEEVRIAISGIKVFEEFEGFGKDRIQVGEVREIKFWDKLKALELLGKNLKLFTDKVELSGKVTLADLVAGSLVDDKK